MLRLFDRGHEEEPRFATWLTLAGATVRVLDPETAHKLFYHPESDCYFTLGPDAPADEIERAYAHCDDVTDIVWRVEHAKHLGVVLPPTRQYGFKDETGHFAGSCDAEITGLPFLLELFGISPDTPILGEFKTHSSKSFAKLRELKVREAKPEHYGQMVTYMQRKGYPLALYCAVNKDNDDLYFEIIFPDPAHAVELQQKAYGIIFGEGMPPRKSNNPFWFGCKFCDYRLVCHYGQPLAKNCRTCRHSAPVANGEWTCKQWGANIPKEAQLVGCDAWQTITD
jgi:hypothetical protein